MAGAKLCRDSFYSHLLLLPSSCPNRQELEEAGEEGVAVPLRPGQISLHHIALAHRSGPAEPGAGRRVGIAIRRVCEGCGGLVIQQAQRRE